MTGVLVNINDFFKLKNFTFLIVENFIEAICFYYNKNKLLFLRHDVVVPASLQCPKFRDGALDSSNIWFSSGGTSSVIHLDSYEHVYCNYRGTKTLTFINSTKYNHLIPEIITQNNGLYNDKIDVDQ